MLVVDLISSKLRWSLLAAALCLTACSPSDEAARPLAAPAPVTLFASAEAQTPTVFEFVGQTESPRAVEIRARVNGFLIKRSYTEGAPVKTGQLLFEIDHKPFQVQADAAAAELAQQQARLGRAKANLARVRPLAEKNALSKKDLDDATAGFYEAAAAVDGARANVEAKKLDLSYTYVRSPLDGISNVAQQVEGAYLSAQNSLLTTVSSMNPMWVDFSVSENQMLQMRAALASGRVTGPADGKYTVSLTLADGTAYPQHGVVTFTGSSYDKKTGTFLVRAELPNDNGVLMPGQFARVQVSGASLRNAIVVPQRAVLHGPKGDFVYIATPLQGQPADVMQATLLPVTVGQMVGDNWEIRQGLHSGDLVVVDGAGKLAPGARIKAAASSPPAPKDPPKPQ
jgi:membrane fusion protein (multidrug efflux system)